MMIYNIHNKIYANKKHLKKNFYLTNIAFI